MTALATAVVGDFDEPGPAFEPIIWARIRHEWFAVRAGRWVTLDSRRPV